MPATRTTTTGRNWIARILAVAMLGTLLGVSGVVGAPSAGALDVSTCRAGNGFELDLPLAVDDGGKNANGAWRFTTTWNSPLNVTTPTLIDNDGFLRNTGLGAGEDFIPNDGRLRAILWSQARYGSASVNADGSWTYRPSLGLTQPSFVEDSFQYVAYDSSSGLCSEPATVSFQVGGFTESVGQAPRASDDTISADGLVEFATGNVRVSEPGILDNDYNSITFQPHSSLVSRIVTPPVWKGTTIPAGTITDLDIRRELDGAVTDAPGSFTFVPARTGYGTATFTYRACYTFVSAVITPCSEPATVTLTDIPSPGPDAAFDFEVELNSEKVARIEPAQLRENTLFDPNAVNLEWEFDQPSAGGWSRLFINGEFRLLQYFPPDRFNPDFTFAGATIPYRLCGNATPTSPRTCTTKGTITVRATTPPPPPPAEPGPKVSSVVLPTTTTGPVSIRFDRPVRGVDNLNTALYEVRAFDLVGVTATVACWIEIPQNRPDGTPVLDANGVQVVQEQTQDCRSGTVTLVRLRPTTPLLNGRSYNLRLNIDAAKGIVGTTDTAPPLEPFQQTFQLTAPDLAPPVATPTAPTPAGTWSRNDVTVTWNWSDGAGSGIDPTRCTDSSTSTGEGVIVLEATCTDRAGNTGTATYEVKVDKTAPAPNPVYSPAVNQGWATGPVTVTWNWTDAGIGIDPATCPATSTLAGEGVLLILETCTDLLGNTGFGAAQAFIDEVAPTASPTFSSPAGPSGWYTNKPLTITWNWTDAGSGLDPANCPPTSTVLSDGGSLVPATCTDVAGNVGRAGGIYLIDSTAPTARPAVSPRPNQGWSNGPVTITWNWDDLAGTGSGIDPARCPATSSASTSGTVTASCTDIAGNTATASQRVDIDAVAPTAAPSAPTGWSRTNPTVVWNWSDTGGSGIDPTVCPFGSVVSGDGIRTVTSTCIDIAGNRSTASAEVKVDTAAPSLAPTVTPNPVLLNGTAAAAANATDGTSGVATQACAAPRTSVLGPATVACTATDVAGNTATGTAAYVVGVGVRWTARPSTIWPDAGLSAGVAVQLTDAAGRIVPASVASRLGSCAVRFKLADQNPVCATYVPLTNTFAAFVTTTRRLTVGTTVNLTATVTSGGTTLGTAATPVKVVRR